VSAVISCSWSGSGMVPRVSVALLGGGTLKGDTGARSGPLPLSVSLASSTAGGESLLLSCLAVLPHQGLKGCRAKQPWTEPMSQNKPFTLFLLVVLSLPHWLCTSGEKQSCVSCGCLDQEEQA
jgi:hypothetical protein